MRSNYLLRWCLILIGLVGVIFAFTIRDENPRPRRRAIQIANPVNHKFEYELDDLKNILEAENIKDRQVVIVSMAGSFRKGKSFLLNFFLRYLHARYQKTDVTDWISERNSTELDGFLWRGGRRPATVGIVMWSEVFTYDYENGDKVAMILLDTQGTFDSRSTLLESTTVFALSTLLSSVQCYNVMQNIQEDDLQHLQLFVEYARLALEQSEEKPFQDLMFIVRDWPNQHEVDYGWGEQFLDEILAEHPTYQDDDMRQLRRQIRSSFARISAFLMPYPGRIVANGQFTGNMEEIDSDFKTYLKILVPSIFAPENLVVKEINGQKVRARELVKYIEQYTKLFNGEMLPEPKTVLQATAEVNNMILYNNSLYEYLNLMGQYFKDDVNVTYYNETELTKIHLDAKEYAMEQFQSKRKLGGDEMILAFQRRIYDEIELRFQDFKAKNEKIHLTLIEEARFHNERCINNIEKSSREKVIDVANGISDNELTILFSKTKLSALREFDSTKKGDNLGDVKFSDGFRRRLEINLDTFSNTLKQINQIQKERNEYSRILIQQHKDDEQRLRDQNENYRTAGKTGAGALAGAAAGAAVAGPPGAIFGFLFGALFGSQM